MFRKYISSDRGQNPDIKNIQKENIQLGHKRAIKHDKITTLAKVMSALFTCISVLYAFSV